MPMWLVPLHLQSHFFPGIAWAINDHNAVTAHGVLRTSHFPIPWTIRLGLEAAHTFWPLGIPLCA